MSNFWVQTFTGKKFDLLEPDESMICIEDIAHHLSILNRWVGATKHPYSIGAHSLMVAKYCNGFELEGLLHDAEEAYINDLSYPLKEALRFEGVITLDNIGQIIKNRVANKFKLNHRQYKDKVKINDLRAAKTERNQLMLQPQEQYDPSYENAEPFPDIIMNLSFDNVEKLFLEAYNKYKRV